MPECVEVEEQSGLGLEADVRSDLSCRGYEMPYGGHPRGDIARVEGLPVDFRTVVPGGDAPAGEVERFTLVQRLDIPADVGYPLICRTVVDLLVFTIVERILKAYAPMSDSDDGFRSERDVRLLVSDVVVNDV